MISRVAVLAVAGVVLLVLASRWSSSTPVGVAATCPTSVSYGDAFDCSTSSNGEVDSYDFLGTSGDAIVVKMVRESGSINPNVVIERPNGTQLCSSSTGGNSLVKECVLDATGTHRLKLSDYGANNTGGYSAYIQRTSGPTGATSISYNNTLTGSVSLGAENDTFTLSGSSGDHIYLSGVRESGSFNPEFRVYRPNGSLECTSGLSAGGASNVAGDCTLDATGTHAFLLGDANGTPSAGDYSVYVQRTNNPSGASSIAFRAAASGSIVAGAETDTFTFSASNGDHVYLNTVRETGNSFSPVLRVYRPDGSVECTSGLSAGGSSYVAGDCTLTATGTHLVLVGDYNGSPYAGDYSVFLQRTNNPTGATSIAFGDTATGSIATGAETDTFAFSATNGDRIYLSSVRESGSSFSPVMRVYRPDGAVECTSGLSGGGYSGYVAGDCTLNATGTHLILLGDANGTPYAGDYSIYIQRTNNPTGASPIAFGDTATGSIATGAETDTFTFSASSGDRVYLKGVRENGSSLSPVFRVYRPDGSVKCTSGLSGGGYSGDVANDCTLDATGTHVFLLGDANGTPYSGDYSVYIQRVNDPTGATAISFGQTFTGSIGVGAEADTFTVSASSGDRVFLKGVRESGSTNPSFRIYRPDGTTVCTPSAGGYGDEVTADCALDATGTFTVLATDDGGSPYSGSYSAHIQRTNNPGSAVAFTYGQTVSGTFSYGADIATYTFAASAGDRIFLKGVRESGSLNPIFRVYRPDGTVQCTAGLSSGSGSSVGGDCALDATGTFKVLFFDANGAPFGGGYSVFIQRTNNPSNVVAANYGQTVAGTMTYGATSATVTFSGSAGERVFMKEARESGSVNPSIRVYRPDGSALCTSGMSTNGNYIGNDCVLDASGTHTIIAGDWDGVPYSGDFAVYLQLSTNTAAAVQLGFGPKHYATSSSSSEMDTYAFNGTAGSTIKIEVATTSGEINPWVRVYRPDGTMLCNSATYSDHHTVNCTPDSNGTHLLLVGDFDGTPGTGAYYVCIKCAAEPRQAWGGFGSPWGSSGGNRYSGYSHDPINMAIGNYAYQVTDITIPGKGVGLEYVRSYNSQDAAATRLGVGWRDNFDARLSFDQGNHATANVTAISEDGRQDDFARNADGTYSPPPSLFDALTRNGDGTFELRRTNGLTLHFSDQGILLSIADRNGNTTSLTYSGGQLMTVTDASGRTLEFTYDADGRVETVTDPLSRVATYGYSGAGDLTSAEKPGGGMVEYAYDGSHQMTSVTDQLGHVIVTNAYTNGKVTSQTNGVGEIWAYSYSSGSTTETDPRGCARTFTYDERYRLTQVRDCLTNATTTYTYDGAGNRTALTDQLGHTSTYTFDEQGNVLTMTDPLDHTWTFTYNALNRVLTATDPLDRVTAYEYDTDGNLTSVTDALDNTTTYVPNSDGTVASVTDPLGNTASFEYDTYGYQESKTDPLDREWTFTHDAGGRLLSEIDPLNHTTTREYDDRDNVVSVTDALDNVTTSAYNLKNLRTSTTDANGNTTEFAYDDADQLRQVTDALDETVIYDYDEAGNRVSMTNPRGKATTYSYDILGRLTAVTDPLDRTTSYSYDAAGRRTARTDARGITTSYTYDNASRLTVINYSDVTPDVSFTYDALGNRVTMTDGTGDTEYTYNELYQRTSIEDGGGNVVGYGYDADGRLVELTYPGGSNSVTYAYDDVGRLTDVTDWLANHTTYGYDDAGRLASTTLGNGLTTERTYDEANRLTEVENRNGAAVVSSYTYTLDDVGNRTQVVDTSGTTTYGYDDLNRLTDVTYPNADVQAYAYDAMGNRTEKTQNTVPTSYNYDDVDQMTVAGGVAYDYDENGNQVQAGSDTFEWDAENRLVGTDIASATGTYEYNGEGLRIARTIGGVSTSFAWSLNGGLPEMLQDTSGNRYVYGLDLLTRIDGTDEEWYLYDGLGSTTGLADDAGTTTGNYDYDAFGAERTHTGASTEWSFTGEQHDSTGLEYLRARYYDADSGRLLSKDPLPLVQRYPYVANNPANYVDPYGLCPWGCRSARATRGAP